MMSAVELIDRMIYRTFNSQICEEKQGAEPGDPRLKGSPCTGAAVFILSRVLCAVDCASLLPKSDSKADPLNHRHADLETDEQ